MKNSTKKRPVIDVAKETLERKATIAKMIMYLSFLAILLGAFSYLENPFGKLEEILLIIAISTLALSSLIYIFTMNELDKK